MHLRAGRMTLSFLPVFESLFPARLDVWMFGTLLVLYEKLAQLRYAGVGGG